MKIFFAYTQLMAVAYYRVFSFAKYMRQIKGVEVAYSKEQVYDNISVQWQNHLNDKMILKQIEMLASTADVSIMGAFNNGMGVALIQALQEMYKKPILTEIDDYVFTLPGYNVASNAYKPGNSLEWIIRKQLEVSDGLIVSTPKLKEFYKDLNKNIYVVPNGVDLDVWDNLIPSKKTGDKIRIGFSGSPNHAGDLRMIKDVIVTILAKYPNVEFCFMGCVPNFLPSYKRVITKDEFVTINKFPQVLSEAHFDIGIAPLKDNNFNRAKSNLRWLELSMLKIPCVASDMPAYKDSIQHNKTGYLAKTSDEWIKYLSDLIESDDLRKELGYNAYLDVRKNHNVKDRASDYVEILKEVKANEQGRNKRRNKKVS